jgi:hypothetical protein
MLLRRVEARVHRVRAVRAVRAARAVAVVLETPARPEMAAQPETAALSAPGAGVQ